MADLSLLPFEAVQRAAETLTDERAKSQLLAALARHQLAAEQFAAALQSFAAIPLPLERRIALLVADFQTLPLEQIEPLVQLLQADPQTELLAGRLALQMLEAKKTESAWKLAETTDYLFESEQQQYDFLEKILPLTAADDWAKILRCYRAITPGKYREWASLVIIKYLAGHQRYAEVERFISPLSTQLRHAWAYWEIAKLSPAEQFELYFDKAVEVTDTVEITSNEDETMEMLAAQLRIFGRTACEKGWREQGERLLERGEAAAAAHSLLVPRYRLQCFLGKVLLELKHITSIREYLPADTMLESLTTGLDRSRVSLWLAEAGWNEGWVKAIEAVSVAERGVTEPDRVQRISEVLARFTAHRQNLAVTGDPAEDAVRLSGEEFETLYFNPFAEWDCDC